MYSRLYSRFYSIFFFIPILICRTRIGLGLRLGLGVGNGVIGTKEVLIVITPKGFLNDNTVCMVVHLHVK